MAPLRRGLPPARIRRAARGSNHDARGRRRQRLHVGVPRVGSDARGAQVMSGSPADPSHNGPGAPRRWARCAARVGIVALIVAAVVASVAVGALGGVSRGIGLGRWLSQPASPPSASNLSVTPVPVARGSHYLAPGSTGDVWIQISNPNAFPVEITAVTLPSSSVDAGGRDVGDRRRPGADCAEHLPSGVTWRGALPNGTSVHVLAAPLVVGASGSTHNPLIVRLADAAMMNATAPASCESTVFEMPALAGLTTTRPAFPSTPSPATDRWSR